MSSLKANTQPAIRASQSSNILAQEIDVISRNHFDTKDKKMEEGIMADTISNDSSTGGAINPTGEVPNIFSLNYCGLLCSYWTTGIFYGLPSMLYGLLIIINQEDRSVYTAASSLVTLFWSYKIFFGLVTDFLPVFGYRRKPYIIGGQVVSVVVCCILGAFADELSANSIIYIMTLLNFFYVFADVASDGLTVELAQREPKDIRGRVQTSIYFARTAGVTIMSVLIGFGLNGKTWGGDFDFEFTLREFFFIAAALAGLPIIGTIFFLKEEKFTPGANQMSFAEHCKDLVRICLRRPIYQLIWYTIVSMLLYGISNNSQGNVNYYWLDVTNLANNINSLVSNVLFLLSLHLVGGYFLQTSWHKMIALTITGLIISGNVSFLFTWDVTRNEWVWVFLTAAPSLINGLNFMVSSFFMVEVTEPGKEAMTYSILSSIHNMVIPVTTVLSNNLGSAFALSNEDIKRDDTEVRAQWSYLNLVVSLINMASLLALYWFPKQKDDAQELCKKPANRYIGWTMFLLAFGLLIYGTIVTVLTVIPSTQCLAITGVGC